MCSEREAPGAAHGLAGWACRPRCGARSAEIRSCNASARLMLAPEQRFVNWYAVVRDLVRAVPLLVLKLASGM